MPRMKIGVDHCSCCCWMLKRKKLGVDAFCRLEPQRGEERVKGMAAGGGGGVDGGWRPRGCVRGPSSLVTLHAWWMGSIIDGSLLV